MKIRKLKVTLVGAGSISFALGTLQDLVLSKRLREETDLEIALMDISNKNLKMIFDYATRMFADFESPEKIWMTTDLESLLKRYGLCNRCNRSKPLLLLGTRSPYPTPLRQ